MMASIWKRHTSIMLLTALIAIGLAGTPGASAAEIVRAEIDLSEQRLYLFVDGGLRDIWPVSTARRGYRTPVGSFRPIRLERSWYSRKYDWAPMPHSVFFLGGYAIHGTTEIKRLGRPVSHGCIRLHPANAASFFNLVRQAGKSDTRIVIRR
jgi:lipoprotein-anchoring transpeptidase ErfK/SrfK